jgi:small ligand-binding sensory domain FIST
VHPDRLLQALDATLGGVPVVGGAASSSPDAEATFQFSGNEGSDGAVSGVRLGGEFQHRVAVSQGCRPVGAPLRVTRAHENLILELDGRPALERLQEVVPQDLLEDPEHALNVVSVAFLPDPNDAVLRPGEYLVRNIVAADPDTGVIGVADAVEEGQSIVFALREPAAARDDLARSVSRLASERSALDYKFGLYFNCLARGRALYRRDGVDAELIARTLPGIPVLGFFCNAEIAPVRGANHLLTYTGVLLLVGE